MLMMRLPPGTYEFRYLAGGVWHTDYAAFGVSSSPFGGQNSVLRVPKVKRPARQPARVRPLRQAALAKTA